MVNVITDFPNSLICSEFENCCGPNEELNRRRRHNLVKHDICIFLYNGKLQSGIITRCKKTTTTNKNKTKLYKKKLILNKENKK